MVGRSGWQVVVDDGLDTLLIVGGAGSRGLHALRNVLRMMHRVLGRY